MEFLSEIRVKLTRTIRTIQFTARARESRAPGRASFSRFDDGSVLVESAFVFPLMLIIAMGIISFGLLISQYLMLSHATDVGARSLAMSRGVSTNPCSLAVSVIQASAPGLNTSSLNYSFNIGSGSFSGDQTSFSGSGSGSCSVDGESDLVAGDNATVTVTYPYQLTLFGWTPTTLTLTATTSEVIQ